MKNITRKTYKRIIIVLAALQLALLPVKMFAYEDKFWVTDWYMPSPMDLLNGVPTPEPKMIPVSFGNFVINALRVYDHYFDEYDISPWTILHLLAPLIFIVPFVLVPILEILFARKNKRVGVVVTNAFNFAGIIMLLYVGAGSAGWWLNYFRNIFTIYPTAYIYVIIGLCIWITAARWRRYEKKPKPYNIRNTTPADRKEVDEIYAYARKFMKKTGNPTQWGDNRPLPEAVTRDIENGNSYVVMRGEDIIGVFSFIVGEDETYKVIDGAWLNDEPYGTIHKIAAAKGAKNILKVAVSYAKTRVNNVRIDTHRDNQVMQHLVAKYGFVYCGIIITDDGTKRLAYQLSENNTGDEVDSYIFSKQ